MNYIGPCIEVGCTERGQHRSRLCVRHWRLRYRPTERELDRRRNGRVPAHAGQCVEEGCDQPGQLRSGLCRNHWRRRSHRQKGPLLVLERALGVGMPLDAVVALTKSLPTETAVERRIVTALARLLDAFQEGQFTIRRRQGPKRRARPKEALA